MTSAGQDDRGGAGRAGAVAPPSGTHGAGGLPGVAAVAVAGRDAGEVRAGVPDRGPRAARSSAPLAGVGANPFAHFPRLIVSIDWLKGELGMRLLREVLPPHPEIPRRYDVLIVDEVHNCAPAGAGGTVRAATRSAHRRSGRWRRTASTGCSCRRRRTTATTTRSRRCWSCSIRSGSRGGSSRAARRRAR